MRLMHYILDYLGSEWGMVAWIIQSTTDCKGAAVAQAV
jgi:hypothetical protein